MRKALIVGIDHYEKVSNLYGCVNDAHSVKSVIERHADGSVNFPTPKMLAASGSTNAVTRAALKDSIEELYKDDSDIALLYFAGHGYIDSAGGYILSSDASRGDEGVSLSEVLTYANNSLAKNKVIILDSCHSGIAGNAPSNSTVANLSEGMTILTASTDTQYAAEQNGGGLYTGLLVDALSGAACNLLGKVTAGAVYAHIDQSLGPWRQRPVFKTNVKEFVSLRSVQPLIPLEDLQRITEFFTSSGFEFPLDPSYEPRDEGRTAEMPRAMQNTTVCFPSCSVTTATTSLFLWMQTTCGMPRWRVRLAN